MFKKKKQKKGGPPSAGHETGPGAPADGQWKNSTDLEAV